MTAAVQNEALTQDMTNWLALIAAELNISQAQTKAAALLLEEGATVPFIARYRKEVTGSLDEVLITAIRDRLSQLKELEQRRITILKSLEDNNHLTDELKEKVLTADNMATLEDIYLPYRPKRRTRASIAKEKGLEPLALALLEQNSAHDPAMLATAYINAEKEVAEIEDALAGARDIIAENINENAEARQIMRGLFAKHGVIYSKIAAGKEDEGAKFRDYFEWEEPVATVPSHRLLAMRRGEKEDFLNLNIKPDEEVAIEALTNMFVKNDSASAAQVKTAAEDCYKRLLSRSMETEIRLFTKERADKEAIDVFAVNLRELLLAAPLGQKATMGVDPGYRTGCKIVCLDRQGALLHNDVIYLMSEGQMREAAQKVVMLCNKFKIEAIAVGNGTASRETETFLRKLPLPKDVNIVQVNESGASIYSASETARKEFPDYDLTVRGAVSIGRRLMDPLAELVKLDPKSIGVGQYQHDVDQNALQQSLDDVVVSCVNSVGVNLNQASAELLTYVSGLNKSIANNIVEYRNQNGAFASRKQLLKVPRLGPVAFEQCAGFLRITGGENPLDASAVHPESYGVVAKMAQDLGADVHSLMNDAKLREHIDLKKYITDTTGLPTLKDIMDELAKPGRDPREHFEAFQFAEGIEKPSDLELGMKLPGIVTNITKFGAFVDIGVHQDGLAHVSEMADHFVSDPATVVKVGQKVMVTVLTLDLERNRIGLSMKSDSTQNRDTASKPKPTKGKKQSDTLKSRDNTAKPFNNPFADLLNRS